MNTAEKIVTLMRAGLPDDAVGVILGVDRDTIARASHDPATAPTVSVAVGPKGDKGDKGDTGTKGDRGDAGAPGVVPPGSQGATGDKGLTGDKGAAGDKGPTGDRGPQGLTGLQGATGQPGTKGATGDKGPTGDPGTGGTGGAAVWAYDGEVSAVSYVDVPGLSGDTDIEYEVAIDGVVVTSGAARNVTLRPNNLTANTYNWYLTQSRAAGVVSQTPAAGPYDGGGLLLGYTDTGDTRVTARGIFGAKSGRVRQFLSRFLASQGASASQMILTQGRWDDAATVVDSLRLDFGGGTFTGRVRVRKI
jgi:hypothetical protein